MEDSYAVISYIFLNFYFRFINMEKEIRNLWRKINIDSDFWKARNCLSTFLMKI